MPARVLVAFTSKHGSTRGIARAIGGALHSSGCEVRVLPACLPRDVTDYDGVVLGSAVYYDHWMWDSRRFLRRLRSQLAGRPLWLFSSGPVGGTPNGDLLVGTGCGPGAAIPATLGPTLRGIEVRGHALFAGQVDHHAIGMLERDAPHGDWRDFRQIGSWGREIGGQLAVATGVTTRVTIRENADPTTPVNIGVNTGVTTAVSRTSPSRRG